MITLSDYLNETEFASNKLIEAVWDDFNNAEHLKKEIQIETQIVHDEYTRALELQVYAEDSDDIMAGVGRYWENYFGADKNVYRKNEKLIALTKSLASRKISLTTLCGNLLEHAKKGLSIIYGHPNNWPTGKMIGTQGLSKIIIETRNQSIHIDEAIKNGGFKKVDIAETFIKLAKEVDILFFEYLKRDMSFEIIKYLDWTTFTNYKCDMLTIV